MKPKFNLKSNYFIQIRTVMCFLGLFLFAFNANAQEYSITNGTVTTCDGIFYDDGGAAGAPYATGQSYTYTICPDNPGDVISINFVAFALFVSPNPNNSDYLAIYDGDDTSAGSLGSYTGSSLQGVPVTGTVNNTTGCLTFTFSSSVNGSGAFPGWEGNITCTTPCAVPTAASEILDPAPMGTEQSIGICLDAPITFADNGSFAEPSFNIEYWVWNFDDGTIDSLTSSANIEHAYTEPGEYLVSLAVIDNNGCRSLNVEPLQILVSTIPVFNTSFSSPVCLDEPTTIDGSPVQSITLTALPPQVVAGETFLADGAGFSYSTTLTFDFFEPGATLDNCDDLQEVFVNIEHSYLGDLQTSITCPNGTNVVLLEYPNGGGGTYLGEAIDTGDQDPGIGSEYGWAPGAMNGNLADQTNIPGLGQPPGNSVPPGTYQSDNDMCALVGCPLNGDWTFSVLDNLAADNGYIFEWGIDFNPALFPDITTFTPIVGLEADSSFWEGPNIISVSENGNTLETQYSEPGFYDYTFFVTNNFNCTFDTTITVEAIEGPEITAGSNLTYCEDPVQLEASLSNAQAPSCGADAGQYTYCYENDDNLVVTYCPDNPGDGTSFMQINILSGEVDAFGDDITFYDGEDDSAPFISSPFITNLAGISFSASGPTGCITMVITSGNTGSCSDGTFDPLVVDVTCVAINDLVWSWSPATGLSDPNIQNPFAEVSQSTTYTLTAFPVGLPGCVITDQVTVSPDELSDPGIDNDTTLCYNSSLSFLTDYLDGDPALGGAWTDLDGNSVPSQFNPTTYPEGGTFNYTYTVTNGTCEGQSFLNLTILPFSNASCCQTNAQAGNNDDACSLVYELGAEPALGIGTWTGPPNVTFSDVNDPQAIATCTTPGGGALTLTWTDNNGTFCSESDDVTINFADELSVFVLPEDTRCFDECTGRAIAVADGGTVSNGQYIFDWKENGAPGLIPASRDSLCVGSYTVLVFDVLGCKDSTTFDIGQPEAQSIFVTSTPPLCHNSCDGKVTIGSAGAVDYSFDSGVSFQNSNVGLVCAAHYGNRPKCCWM